MIRDIDGGVAIDVLIQPRASRPRIGPVHGDRIKIAVSAPPVNGAANEALAELLARRLRVPRSAVAVTAGAASRRKTVTIAGIERAAIEGLLS